MILPLLGVVVGGVARSVLDRLADAGDVVRRTCAIRTRAIACEGSAWRAGIGAGADGRIELGLARVATIRVACGCRGPAEVGAMKIQADRGRARRGRASGRVRGVLLVATVVALLASVFAGAGFSATTSKPYKTDITPNSVAGGSSTNFTAKITNEASPQQLG